MRGVWSENKQQKPEMKTVNRTIAMSSAVSRSRSMRSGVWPLAESRRRVLGACIRSPVTRAAPRAVAVRTRDRGPDITA